MTTALVLLLCSLHSSGDGGLEKLSHVDAYTQPDSTVHIIVRNESDQSLTLHPRSVESLSTESALPVWWLRSIPETVAPAACGHIEFSLKHRVNICGRYRIVFDEGSLELILNLEDSRPLLTVAYLVLDPDQNEVYVFLRNRGGNAVQISALAIDGIPLEMAEECGNQSLPSQASAMFHAPRPHNLSLSGPCGAVVVRIKASNTFLYRHAFFFDKPVFLLGSEDSENRVFQCPTHQHGAWDKVGCALFSHAAESAGIPTVHFCRNRFTEGLTAFGQCLPRALVNLQGSDLERGKPAAWDAFRSNILEVSTSVEPGVFAVILEPNSLLEGDYIHPPDKTAPSIPARELKHLAYLAIANGAKGILFRMGDNPKPDFKAMADVLARDLCRIAPLLGAANPITLPTLVSNPSAKVSVLSCGGDAFLAVLTSADLVQTSDPTGVTVSLELPFGFLATRWMEIGGSWKSVELSPPTNNPTIALDGFKDDALLLISR